MTFCWTCYRLTNGGGDVEAGEACADTRHVLSCDEPWNGDKAVRCILDPGHVGKHIGPNGPAWPSRTVEHDCFTDSELCAWSCHDNRPQGGND